MKYYGRLCNCTTKKIDDANIVSVKTICGLLIKNMFAEYADNLRKFISYGLETNQKYMFLNLNEGNNITIEPFKHGDETLYALKLYIHTQKAGFAAIMSKADVKHTLHEVTSHPRYNRTVAKAQV